MAMLIVNGWDAPAPSGMQVALMDVGQNANRSASGLAVADRAAVKRRLEITWAHLSGENLARLLGETDGFFDVSYPDPLSGGMRSMQCSCGEKAAGILRMQDGAPIWTDVKMTWTER